MTTTNTKSCQFASAVGLMLATSVALASEDWGVGIPYTTQTSSSLGAVNEKRYTPENVIAPSINSAWCEGLEGYGVGEWIELQFETPITKDSPISLYIIPGYVKSPALYEQNARPERVRLTFNHRHDTDSTIIIADTPVGQKFDIPAAGEEVRSIRLQLDSVYPGSIYTDTCISEIAVFNRTSSVQPSTESIMQTIDLEQGVLVQTIEEALSGDAVGIETLQRLSTGSFIRSAEGGEWLNDLYYETFLAHPERFMYVLNTIGGDERVAVLKEMSTPVSEQYWPEPMRTAIIELIKSGTDVGDIGGLKEALDITNQALEEE